MKEVTVYQAVDGKRFDRRADALSYEMDITAAAQLFGAARQDSYEFQNGEVFIQHPTGLKATALAACMSKGHPRVLEDAGSAWYKYGWYRVMCMDDKDREWGQPYFANNPNPHAVAAQSRHTALRVAQ